MRKYYLAIAVAMLVAACGNAGTTNVTTTLPPVATSTSAPPATVTTSTATTTTTTTPTIVEAVDPITGSIDGVQVYEDISQAHADGDVEYDVRPPVGGMHAAKWVPCGFYDSVVVEEEAVHSLEHGAVWVTYDAGVLEADDVSALANLAAATFEESSPGAAYVLVSPYPDMPSPIVASAWGRQLLLDTVDDPRLALFLLHFASGPQTPEPGAPC